jgi:Fic-DOC domain mobile mystery protein B
MIFEAPDGATPLDDDELADLLPTHITTHDQLNEWEQENILRAEDWLLRRRDTHLVSEEFFRTLHHKMFEDTWRWAGAYRRTDKNIGVHWPRIAAELRTVCNDAGYWLENRSFDLDEIAARLHHRVVSVHPFPNGNGRHSRLLADALLIENGRPRFSWGSANLAGPGQARDAYIRALKDADALDYARLVRFARA